jgi:hypothetical protein
MSKPTPEDGTSVSRDVPGLADAMIAAITTAIVEAPIVLDGESPDPDKVAALKRELKCCGQCGVDCRATKAAARKG